MGYDARTAERVRRILAGQGDVVEKRMVGGLSFVVQGSMCCGVTSTGVATLPVNKGGKRSSQAARR
jgi:hypothetical protein